MEEINEVLRLIIKFLLNFVLHVMWIFPIKKNRISLINDLSYSYGDNLKYICEYLIKRHPNKFEIVFPLKNKKEIRHSDTKIIIPGPKTIFTFYYLLTSHVLVTNVGGISYLPLRKNQLVINTWHGGGPYKKTGIDTSHNLLFSYDMRISANKTHYILSSCDIFTKKECKALLFPRDKCLNIGSPRNDMMFQKGLNIKQKVYSFYGIQSNKKIALYAPTFRNKDNKVLLNRTAASTDLTYEAILSALEKRWGGDWILAQRFHPKLKNIRQETTCNCVINFSSYPDMQELLYVADIVISDYSSLMWDFSLTGRPCFILSDDIEEYSRSRGFYIPIEKWPYPIAHNSNELIQNIINFDEKIYLEQLKYHHNESGSFETGTATKQLVKLICKHIKQN